jgi:hypothetical protein
MSKRCSKRCYWCGRKADPVVISEQHPYCKRCYVMLFREQLASLVGLDPLTAPDEIIHDACYDSGLLP